ncbi:MAG: metalloregulator ArsR/SmtB family transcription factor [Spirochaetota bacterium]
MEPDTKTPTGEGKTAGKAVAEGSGIEDFASEERCLRVAGTLSLISNPRRLKILCMLAVRDRSVDELVQGTGGTFPAISQQLKLLTLAGFLERRREGRNIFYRLKDEQVLSILHHLKSLYMNPDSPNAGTDPQ